MNLELILLSMSNELTITKILEVIDTREWEEVADGKFKAIAGSGDSRKCDRCGRSHEVHATVELSDGNTACVGTGCMNGSKFTKALKSAAAAAKRVARARAEAAHNAKLAAEADEIRAAVAGMTKPEMVEVTVDGKPRLRMGDAEVWLHLTGRTTERERCLAHQWESNRERELGMTNAHNCAATYQSRFDAAVERAKASLAKTLA